MALEPKSVATFYREFMDGLRSLGIEVRIWTRPVEVADAIPFEADEQHASYDPRHAQACWRGLLQADRVMKAFQSGFVGKASPGPVLLGQLRPGGCALLGQAGAAPSRRGTELPGLGDGGGVFPRGAQHRLVAVERRPGPRSTRTPTRSPAASGPRRSVRRRPSIPDSASSCCRTTRCVARPNRMRPRRSSSRAPMKPAPIWAAGIGRASSRLSSRLDTNQTQRYKAKHR